MSIKSNIKKQPTRFIYKIHPSYYCQKNNMIYEHYICYDLSHIANKIKIEIDIIIGALNIVTDISNKYSAYKFCVLRNSLTTSVGTTVE